MLRTIWQFMRNEITRRRSGLDNADIQHIRADLRFRLALVEYAYFGKNGKKVARSLAELKSLLGEKAIHRYLRSLDPDLRTQFVERFQNKKRDAEADASTVRDAVMKRGVAPEPAGPSQGEARIASSNVVPIGSFARRTPAPNQGEKTGGPEAPMPPADDSHSADSSE